MKSLVVPCALLWALPAAADFDAASYPPYETCALCHGLFGQSRTDKFPHLAGQKPAYIRAQLDAFLSGERTNDGGQMSSIVTELKPEDFAVVVDWFSEQDPPSPSTQPTDDAGMSLAQEAGCLECHASAENAPYVTAQHAGYLAKQMRDFRDGVRTNSAAAEMHREFFQSMEDGIDQIAAYLASLERTP
ncbi:c-type cytochrome [uncultured Tateyamaria sp.]|uniref:c-type cytochrome n=1 Tax=uncultured Tateyamaria sp. TaxID=455651 RepID=UPI0026325ED0|nr:c-type cytochrome [uncultured Tateyamaria sp.]